MIYRHSDLFYDIYNTINEHNGRQTHYFSLILNYFDICFSVNQKVISMLLLFIIIYGRNKVICYCSLNFRRVKSFEIIYDVF